jgi:hypothetical protein
MLNYEKWKKLNESFMMSTPMRVTSPKGLLAYTPLHEKMEDEEEEDEDMEDEEEEDEDMEDEEEEDEDMEDEEEDDEDMEDEEDDEDDHEGHHHHEDEDDMEDEVDMQDETGEVEVVEDGDEDEDSPHDHGKMVVAKKCGYCGSYMKAESTSTFDSTPDFQEWLESVNSIINPRINSRLNGDILNEGAIPPQFVKYIKAKKKGKKVLDKTSSKKGKKVIVKKKGKKTVSKKPAKKCNCNSTEMKVMPKKSRCMTSKKSWKNSPKK